MDQETRWLARYNEVKDFIAANHRNPSKYYDDEKLMVHFLKRNRKLMNAGELAEPRLSMFKELRSMCEQKDLPACSSLTSRLMRKRWFPSMHSG